jgi:hypothetical protein
MVYNITSQGVKDGTLLKDEAGRYRLPDTDVTGQ